MGLDLSGLDALGSGLETAAGVLEDVNQGIETIKGIGGTLGLWDPPAGEDTSGRWAFTAANSYPGRKRREGDTWTGTDGRTYSWAFLLGSDPWQTKLVREIPRWVPLVAAGPLGRQTDLIEKVWKAGARDSDVERIAALDPMAGLGEAGTTFDALDIPHQRAYLANAIVIAAMRYRDDPVKFGEAWGQVASKQLELGWCQYAKDPKCSQTGQSRDLSLDGRPITLMAPDFTRAAARAVLIAHGTTGIVQLDAGTANGTKQPAAAAGWESCLAEATPLEKRRTCLDAAIAADPSITTALDALPEPWRPFVDAEDKIQWIKGANGASYLKMGTGSDPWVIRGEVALSLGGAIVLGAAGLVYALVRAYVR